MKLLSGKPGKITPKVLGEQTRFSFDVFPVTVAMLTTTILVIAYLAWNEVNQQEALIWFGACAAVMALRIVLYYTYKRSDDSEERAALWRVLFLVGAYSTSVLLAWAGFEFFTQLTSNGRTVFMLILLGIVSGSLPVLAMDLRSYAIYVIIALSPLVYLNLGHPDIHLKLLGVLTIVYIIMLMLSGYLFNRAMIDSLIYRYRSQTLAERLQIANQRLSSANEELQRISTIDELTGTYNRRYFNQRFEEVWNDHLREGMTLSALMIDVDHFKIYNDNYGHLSGDNCLQRIAQEIMQVIHRPRDFVARFGGEEFIVILPNTQLAGAKQIAARVHKQIERLAIPQKRPDNLGRVTVSIGGASIIPSKDVTDDGFLQHIDRALYQAKNAGRNGSIFL